MGGARPRGRPQTSAGVVPAPLAGPVSICIDRPILSLDRPFTYALPVELAAGVGSLVSVRFHGKLTRGWVLGPTDDIPPRMLKVHKLVSPVPYFDSGLLDVFRWMSERYVAPLATVIGRSYPPRVAGEEGERAGTRPAAPAPRNGFAGALRASDANMFRSGAPPVASASLASYRRGDELVRSITEGRGGTFRVRPAPEQEQELVVEAVGSALGAGRSSLVIVPEAQPIPATAGAIVEAFGDRVGLFLGGDKRGRYRMWLDIRAGRYDVVVGTRPAVFAPVRDLGLVWLAREGHALHREERSPSFHVRDVAARRSAVAGAVFVMSAFCHTVEASLLDAVDVSPEGRAWPPVEVVRPGPEGRAPRLVAALKEVGRAFLYEPLPGAGVAQLCKACGEPAACAECGGMLRLEGGRVACVVCEAAGRCAHCGGTEFGIARGGAERVEAWVRRLVDVPVRRGDTLEPEGMTVGGAETVKEVPPPGLDLVGILDADLAARRPGLSAMERSLALWMDAASWAAPKGRVIVQTRRPSDPATQALVQGTPTRFHRAELARRAEAGFPVGHPVFRVSGKPELVGELRALEPVHLLETSLGEERVCLVTVRPDRLLELGRVLRSLAVSGTVIRVEAEPHL